MSAVKREAARKRKSKKDEPKPKRPIAVAKYKGRRYLLLYLGETKYGFRAHLAFFDRTSDFWVDGDKVEVEESNYNQKKDETRKPRKGGGDVPF